MLLYEETYRVQAAKIPEYQELLKEFKIMLSDLDIPILKDWYVLQNKYIPGDIRNVWILEDQSNVEEMWDICFTHQKWMDLVPKIFNTMIDGSYNYSFWAKAISL